VVPPNHQILQANLARIRDYRDAGRSINELRLDIIAMLQADVPTEPGPLTARVDFATKRYLTLGHVRHHLGAPAEEYLRRCIAPTRYKRLFIAQVLNDRP